VDALAAALRMSPLSPEADITAAYQHVRHGPIGDVIGLFDHLVGAGGLSKPRASRPGAFLRLITNSHWAPISLQPRLPRQGDCSP
jgi:hypothetical protein